MRTLLLAVAPFFLVCCSSSDGAGGGGGQTGPDTPTTPPVTPDPVPPAPANMGELPADAEKPFVATPVASFDVPFGLAVLPDGRLLVTEKKGRLLLVTAEGGKTTVSGVPAVAYGNQGGLLAVLPSPRFAEDGLVYLSFSEPGDGGSSLALARGRLVEEAGGARLDGLQVIWRQLPKGDGGQFGAYMTFSPDGQSLFLASGERMRKTPAQDPEQALGKILRLTPDGRPAPDNPQAGQGGVRAETWTTGHRNQYGLAFDGAGRLWETEMGPRGGDELNLIEPGKNYGWPEVSYGINYDGTPIPSHDTEPKFQKPVLYWTPVIAPAGFTFYQGSLFPDWKGSAFVGGLSCQCIVRIAFDGVSARQVNRWEMGNRIRNVVAGADGALWALEDGEDARLLRITPKP